MATLVMTDASLWLHDIAVHDLTHTLELSTGREAQDATVMGNTARRFRPGLFTVNVSAQGYADMTAFDASIYSVYDNATTAPLSIAATSADGDTAYTTRSLMTTLAPLGGEVGSMAAVSVEAQGRGGVRPVRGTILHPETARTSTSVGTGRQLGAVSATQTVYGALHVVAASGTTPTLAVVVQSDDNSGFTSPTTRLTFTTATGTTAEWQSAAGAITDTWWRVSYTIAGTSPSFTFATIVGIAST